MARMLVRPIPITGMGNVGTSPDGAQATFSFKTDDNRPHSFTCPTAYLEELIYHLASLALQAGERLPSKPPRSGPHAIKVHPIKALQLGVGGGQSPAEFSLAVGLGSIDLAFELPTSTLRDLRAPIDRLLAKSKSGHRDQ